MATTEHFYTGNGSTTTFAFTFPYLSNNDVKVELDDVVKTENSSGQTDNDYTISNTNIVFNSAPASSVAIHIYRNTNVDTAQATYAAGSSIRAVDLNNNQTQVLYSSQEAIDQLIQTSDLSNSVVTSAKIADGTIATGDIADSAVSTAKIADAAVTTSKINDNAVTMSKLGSGVLPSDVLVQTDNLVDGTITNVDINLSLIHI